MILETDHILASNVLADGVRAASLRAVDLGAVALATLIALGIRSADRYHARVQRWPWRQITTSLAEVAREDSIVIAVSGQEVTVLNYYFGRRTDPMPAFDIQHPRADKVLKHVRGADTEDRVGPARAVQQGWLTSNQMLWGTAVVSEAGTCATTRPAGTSVE